jgi:hypothetical protein
MGGGSDAIRTSNQWNSHRCFVDDWLRPGTRCTVLRTGRHHLSRSQNHDTPTRSRNGISRPTANLLSGKVRHPNALGPAISLSTHDVLLLGASSARNVEHFQRTTCGLSLAIAYDLASANANDPGARDAAHLCGRNPDGESGRSETQLEGRRSRHAHGRRTGGVEPPIGCDACLATGDACLATGDCLESGAKSAQLWLCLVDSASLHPGHATAGHDDAQLDLWRVEPVWRCRATRGRPSTVRTQCHVDKCRQLASAARHELVKIVAHHVRTSASTGRHGRTHTGACDQGGCIQVASDGLWMPSRQPGRRAASAVVRPSPRLLVRALRHPFLG